MSNWHAVLYPVKAGTEQLVAELFQQARLSDPVVRDGQGAPVGRLLGTMVFAGPGRILRVIEFEGTLPQLIAHLRRQRGTADFQLSLNPYLDLPVAPSGPEHVGGFFRDAALEWVAPDAG